MMGNLSRSLFAALAGLAAGLAAFGLMAWARAALQVRTLPERVMDALLLLIPPAQFEVAIERFGPAAKEYALDGTTIAMVALLGLIGWAALRWLRRPAAFLALGLGLWLLTAVAIMPLTGAGFFGIGLFQSPLLTNSVYLGIGLAYGSLLLAARLSFAIVLRWSTTPDDAWPERRALLAGAAGTLVAFGATVWFGRTAGQIASSLPLASVPAAPSPSARAASAAAPQAAPAPASASLSASPVARSANAAASIAPSPAPTYPVPPPEQPLARDKDGALLAVNRPKGQRQPAVTANNDFYTVTKNAGGDPRLEAQDWRLIVDGAVNQPVQVDYLTLVKLPAITIYKTLECISNLTAKCELTSFGCDLISTAQWKGARLKDVLALAGGAKPGAVAIAAVGADEFSSSIPASSAGDPDVLLAYEMNGVTLPREHGFPVRLLMPNRYGMKSAKWLVKLKVMTVPFVDWYGQRNWNQEGIVRTMARIDVPANGSTIQAEKSQIAGIAYAGGRGIAKVESSADRGRTWRQATLEPALGKDTFVRWESTFAPAAGQTTTLICRATDGTGQLQPNQFSLPQPNGGSGWHSIDVRASG
ncbi:MAG: molybdopterin-dependent oxidoreductase [Chloroflexota bacterium]|nr:molybdopterin-dependent oxidoreductase [Chloroflexota bacterium]